jgi:hypothetical protein
VGQKKKDQERVPPGKQEKANAGDSLAKTLDASSRRGARNLQVSSLDDLASSFVENKSVMDMHYCVTHLDSLRGLAADHHLSKFSDLWAPDYKHIMPLKVAFTPAHLVSGKNTLLTEFYDPGRTTSNGDKDPLNLPHYRVSRELMGRIVHTFKRQYISQDDDRKMSVELEEYLKGIMGLLETAMCW